MPRALLRWRSLHRSAPAASADRRGNDAPEAQGESSCTEGMTGKGLVGKQRPASDIELPIWLPLN